MATGWKHPLCLILNSDATPSWRAAEAMSDLPLANMVGTSCRSLGTLNRLDGHAAFGTTQHAEVGIEADQIILDLFMSVSFACCDKNTSSEVHLTCLDRSDGNRVVGRRIQTLASQGAISRRVALGRVQLTAGAGGVEPASSASRTTCQ